MWPNCKVSLIQTKWKNGKLLYSDKWKQIQNIIKKRTVFHLRVLKPGQPRGHAGWFPRATICLWRGTWKWGPLHDWGGLKASSQETFGAFSRPSQRSFPGSGWIDIPNSILVAFHLIRFLHMTRTEQLNKIHGLLPNPTFAFGAPSFCKPELCVAAAS